jgi:molybdopterin converting factor small subunit
MVRVKLYGAARKLAGQAEMSLSVESGTTLEAVLRRLSGDAGGVPPGVVSTILVNGRNCAFREGLNTQVVDGDLIELLPIIAGG